MELSFHHNHKVSNLKVNSERVIIVFLISCRILTNSPQLPRGSSGPNQYKQNFVFCFTISAQDHITTLLSLMKERKREIVERKRENSPDRFATFKDVFRKKNIIFINPGRKELDCQFDEVRRENQICYLKYFVSFHNKRFLQHIVRQLSTSHSEYYNEREHMNQI